MEAGHGGARCSIEGLRRSSSPSVLGRSAYPGVVASRRRPGLMLSTPSLRPLRFLKRSLTLEADLLSLRILKLQLFWGVNAVQMLKHVCRVWGAS
jgi:hypothetical protein